MPLVALAIPLTTEDDIFSFQYAHARDHDEIDQALGKRGLPQTFHPVIDQIPAGPDEQKRWLLDHAQKHWLMNAALNLFSSDLSEFDLQTSEGRAAFMSANFDEHYQARIFLGI